MKTGDVLYRKGATYELVYTRSEGEDIYGYVRTTSGREWAEKSVISILAHGYWEAVEGVVEKHGTHDQSSHNPWKTRGAMRGYAAGQWRRESDPAKAEAAHIEASVAAHEQRIGREMTYVEREDMKYALATNPAITAVRQKELEGAEVYLNGSSMLIVKRDKDLGGAKGIVRDEEIAGLLGEVDRMQRDFPIAGLKVHVDNQAFIDTGRDPNTAMFAYRSGASHAVEPHIFIKTSSMRTRNAGMYGAVPYFQQTTDKGVSLRRIQLTHEWGHLMDKKDNLPFELKDKRIQGVIDRVDSMKPITGKPALAFMTPYGATDVAEQFAESFAQYAIFKQKGWKLENPLTLEMAKEFKW